ncbi:PREDICTED: uncharacterized protein LOC109486819 [Branchiostoma belcheri]|uniref:Uncharacterized protein LOC109486819 n=1 Tax=Branchiostoma belcheri TaxID=7741 RepID=A0A6P4ZYP3_BRABE|nr:PREDICTED: uncharacterized protein LOC109486819 [Branchiostoma belcheri]
MFTACGDVFARGTTLPSTLPAWQSPVVCSLPIPEQGNADSSHFWTLPGVNFGQQFPLCVSAGPILTMPGVPFLSTVPPVVLVPSSRSPSALSRVRKFCKKQSSKIWTIVAICIVVSLLIVLAYPDNHAQRARLMHVPHETNVKVVSGHTSSNHDLRTTSSHHTSSTLSTVTTMTTGVSSFAPSSTRVSETTGGKTDARRRPVPPSPDKNLGLPSIKLAAPQRQRNWRWAKQIPNPYQVGKGQP